MSPSASVPKTRALDQLCISTISSTVWSTPWARSLNQPCRSVSDSSRNSHMKRLRVITTITSLVGIVCLMPEGFVGRRSGERKRRLPHASRERHRWNA